MQPKLSNLLKNTVLLAAFALCFNFMYCTNAVKDVARSEVLQPMYNAGRLKPTDTVIKHTFLVKSTGTADLRIDSVGGSCTCVDIKWQKGPIKPGQTGYVNITLKPSAADTGRLKQYVVVKTNSTTPLSVLQIFFIK